MPRDPDAPRPRGAAHASDDRSTVLVGAALESPAGRPGAASPPPRPRWPRTRTELENALHGIGLALDDLLDGATIPDAAAVTTVLPESPSQHTDPHLRLRELLAEAELDASAIEIHVEGERVTLSGRVPDALARLLVEDLAWSLPSVRDCENRIVVGVV